MRRIELLLADIEADPDSKKINLSREDDDDYGDSGGGIFGEDLYQEIANGGYLREDVLIRIAKWIDGWVYGDDIDQDMHNDGMIMLQVIAERLSKQGDDNLAIDILQLIPNEYHRSVGYGEIALHKVQSGYPQHAFELMTKITVLRSATLTRLAEELVKSGYLDYFYKMIVPMSYQKATAYASIRLLLKIYPDQFDDIMFTLFERKEEI